MKFMRIALLPFLIAAVTFAPILLAPADARATAKANNISGALSVGTGNFSTFATTSSGGSSTGTSLVLSRTNGPQNFYIRNAGNIAITGLSLTVSFSPSPGTSTLYRCDQNVTFISTTLVCNSGISHTVGTGSISLSIAGGAWYEFQVDPLLTTTPTISVSVSASQIRAGTVTNS